MRPMISRANAHDNPFTQSLPPFFLCQHDGNTAADVFSDDDIFSTNIVHSGDNGDKSRGSEAALSGIDLVCFVKTHRQRSQTQPFWSAGVANVRRRQEKIP